ncbi:MAG TPA: SpoIIE family protein phosphatase [Herpetosiphonaceae bacterium]
MIYATIPIMLLYAALAVYLLARHRDNIKARSLAFFALFSIVGVAGVLILGTSASPERAFWGAWIALVAGVAGNPWFLLSMLLGVFFPQWLRMRRGLLLWLNLLAGAVLMAATGALAFAAPLAEPGGAIYVMTPTSPAFAVAALGFVSVPISIGLLLYAIRRLPGDRRFAALLLASLLVGFSLGGFSSMAGDHETQLVLNGVAFLPSCLLVLVLLSRGRLFTLRQFGIDRAANQSVSPILVLDDAGLLTWCNRAAAQAIQAPRARQIGLPFAQIAPSLIPTSQIDLSGLLDSHASIQSMIVDCDDGRSRELTIQPIIQRWAQQEGWMVVIQDVTERKQAEDRARRYQSDLEREVRERTVELTAANDQLQQLASELQARHDSFQQGLVLARDIQLGLLPETPPWGDDLLGVAVCCVPAAEVGGDFYEFISLGDERSAVAIGDISGKGVGAALLMALVSGHVETCAIDNPEPAAVLSALNAELTPRLRASKMNAAVLYVLFDWGRSTLRMANAGMVAPLLWRAGQVRLLEIGGLPLGMLAGAEYPPQELALLPGDLLVLVSDGIVEARNPAGELFGFERLEEFITAHAQAPIQDLSSGLLTEVALFADGALQADDMTVVLLQLAPSASPRRAEPSGQPAALLGA